MSEQGDKPEVLPGDLITRPGVYESRSQCAVEVRHWDEDGWVAQWEDGEKHYFADGTRTGLYPMPDPYQLLRWVGPLPATEPETETTSEQLAEIEGQAEPEPPDGWQLVPLGEPLKGGDEYHAGLDRYIRPIEPQPQPKAVQVREGQWRTRNGDIRNVTATPEGDGREHSFPWWDAQYRQTWALDGRYYTRSESPLDLVEYLGPLEQQPKPQPQPPMLQDADERIRLLKQANDAQAETIERLQTEARDLKMEIGGLERQLLQRDARIRDLETMHAAATQAVVDAGKQNDALRLQVQNRQQEYERQKGRIAFLETLDAGNAVAIVDYRAQVEKLQGLIGFANQQLEAAASERDELRAAVDQADKQLDQKDAQIRDLRIELDAAQQVQQPVSDEEREQIWNEATEAAGRQVVRWLRPLTLALNRQPDERFSRFMALTLSVLPDVLPELLGYAVEDESLDSDEDCE